MYWMKRPLTNLVLLLSLALTPFAGSALTASVGEAAYTNDVAYRNYHRGRPGYRRYYHGSPYRRYYYGRPGGRYHRYRGYYPRRYYYYNYPGYRYHYYRDPYYFYYEW